MGSSLQHVRTRVLALVTALAVALGCLAAPGQVAQADTGTTQQGNSGQFVSLPLVGLYDTLSGVNAPVAKIPANGSVTVQVAGKAGIPTSGVSAVALNIWKRGGSDGYGYLVLRPSDKPSTAVTLYYNPTDHNSTDDLIRLTSTGKLTLTNTGPNPVDVRIAVRGYFLDASATQAATEYHPLNAAYLYDSRPGIGPADGPKTPLASKTPITLQVTDKAGIPATGVDSVAINIAALGATTNAGLSLWADGESDPTSSTLLYTAGENTSLTDIVRVGTNGRIRLVNHGANPINVAIAIRGYFKKTAADETAGAGFEAVEPKTLLRTDSGVGTAGGTTTPLAARASLTFTATTGTNTAPDLISAVAGSLTAFQPAATGSLSITPTDSAEPKIGVLNFMKGETSQLTEIVSPGQDGKLTITNHSDATVHVQYSIRGYFVAPPQSPSLGLDFPSAEPGEPVTVNLAYAPANITSVEATSEAFSGGKITLTRASAGAPLSGRGTIPQSFPAGTYPITATLPTAAEPLTTQLEVTRYSPAPAKVVLDTLNGVGTPDGQITPLAAGESFRFKSIADPTISTPLVAAITLNISARRPTQKGWLSLHDGLDPEISSLNFNAGVESTSGSAKAAPDSDGYVTVTNHSTGTVHIQVSVNGYYLHDATDFGMDIPTSDEPDDPNAPSIELDSSSATPGLEDTEGARASTQRWAKCNISADTPHWSKGGQSVIYKTRVNCWGAGITRVSVYVKGSLGYVYGGVPGRCAAGPATQAATSSQSQTISLPGSTTFYTPVVGGKKVRRTGTFSGYSTASITSPLRSNVGSVRSKCNYVKAP